MRILSLIIMLVMMSISASAQTSGGEVTRKTLSPVLIEFVVEKDGSITSLIVKQPVHPLLDEEALRVISIMPRWFPAVAKDQNIRVKYTVPITFRL